MTSQNHTSFMLVKATRHWLNMAPEQRFTFVKEQIQPILGEHHDVTMRFFDTESYTARISDILVWTSPNLLAYQSVIRKLRDTLFWDHYFDVVQIITAVENGYAEYYGIDPLTAA